MSLVFQDVDSTRRGRRVLQFSAIVIVTFTGLFVRLATLQLTQESSLTDQSVRNYVRRQQIPAKRGSILDRNGVSLAQHKPTYRLVIYPTKIKSPEETVRALADAIGLNERERLKLEETVRQRKSDRNRSAYRLDQALEREAVGRIEVIKALHSGIEIRTSYERVYPEKSVGAHLLGYLGLVSASELASDETKRLRTTSRVGRFGLEKKYETVLAGRPGFRQFAVDARGRRIEADWARSQIEGFVNQRPPMRGQDIVLTIDTRVQRILQNRLKAAQSGAAIVMNAHTGDILGMVSHPSYNPNEWSGGLSAQTKKRIDENQYNPMLDKSVNAYFPGSLYKIVTAYAALEDGVLDHSELIKSPGAYEYGNRIFHCHKRSGHGRINLKIALAASADVYFYKLGEQMGIDRLADYAKEFGFGERTELKINGEQRGIVPTKAFHEEKTKGGFQHGLSLSTAVGQGAVRSSPLQIAVAFAAIANGGKVVAPRLVSRIQDVDGAVSRSFQNRVKAVLRPGYPDAIRVIAEGLTHAVSNKDKGTAIKAKSELVEVSGKTGTAQVRQLSRTNYGQAIARYRHRDHAWFAGYAPTDNPEWVVVVFLEHGGSGGKKAAPVARQILEDIHLRVQPITAKLDDSKKEAP